jgi:hypothetical protein
MTSVDELRAYIVECVEHIRFGHDLADDEFHVVLAAIGRIKPHVADRMLEMLSEGKTPAEVAACLMPADAGDDGDDEPEPSPKR